MSTENQGTSSTTGKTVSASAALEMLHSGKTRKEINESFGLTAAEGRFLWSQPGLKGRKYVPPVQLTVINDIPEATSTLKTPATEADAPKAKGKHVEAEPEVAQAEEIPVAEKEENLWNRK